MARATPSFDELVSQGHGASQRGDYDEALARYNSALAMDSASADLHERRGYVFRLLGRPEEAVEAFKDALQLEPGRADLLIDEGDALIDAQRAEEAITAFERATALEPDSMTGVDWTVRGDRMYNAGEFNAAETLYRRGCEVEKTANGFRGLGLVYQARGEHEAALGYYTEALNIEPHSALLINDRGVMLSRLGRKDEALESFEEVTRLDPEDIYGWMNTGRLHFEDGRFEEARSSFQIVLELEETRSDSWLDLGGADLKLGSMDTALAAFEKAIDLENGESFWGLNNAGMVLEDMGRNEEALTYFDRAIDIDRSEGVPWQNKVDLLYEEQRVTEAEAVLEEGLASIADEVDALQWRSSILTEKHNQHDEALELLQQALAAQPGDVEMETNMAELLTKVGRYAESRKLIRRLLKEHEMSSESRCALLFIYYVSYVLGGTDTARRHDAFLSFIDYYHENFVVRQITSVDWDYAGLVNVIRSRPIHEEDRYLLLGLIDAQGATIDPWTIAYFVERAD